MYRAILLFTVLFSINLSFAQTTHTVEVGGNMQVEPYFLPQHLTIEEGDIVLWECVQGTHNIDGQQSLFPNNPESFSYSLNGEESPWDFSFTFNMPGVYNYECSMWDHNKTQFGSITVTAATSISESAATQGVLFPNPANDQITVRSESPVFIFNHLGELIFQTTENTIDISSLRAGVYLLQTAEKTEKFIKR